MGNNSTIVVSDPPPASLLPEYEHYIEATGQYFNGALNEGYTTVVPAPPEGVIRMITSQDNGGFTIYKKGTQTIVDVAAAVNGPSPGSIIIETIFNFVSAGQRHRFSLDNGPLFLTSETEVGVSVGTGGIGGPTDVAVLAQWADIRGVEVHTAPMGGGVKTALLPDALEGETIQMLRGSDGEYSCRMLNYGDNTQNGMSAVIEDSDGNSIPVDMVASCPQREAVSLFDSGTITGHHTKGGNIYVTAPTSISGLAPVIMTPFIRTKNSPA